MANLAVQVESLWNGLTDANGNALSGGKVYTYKAGTTTNKDTYTTADKSSTASNPVILDSEGKALIFANGLYKFKVTDSNDVEQAYSPLDNLEYFHRYSDAWIDARDYNDGSLTSATLQAAIDAIGANEKTLLIAPGTWVITANLTFPSNIELNFMNGAVFNVSTSYTVTINGKIQAPLTQIFSGTGTSTFGSYANELKSEWWSDLNTAISDLGSSTQTLIISSSQTLTASLTIPSNIELHIRRNGLIVKASSYTLTLNCGFKAEFYKVFSGFSSGDVKFGDSVVREVYPQWWGAVGDGTTDSTAAITSAIGSLTGGIVYFTRGHYITTGIVVNGPNRISLIGEASGVYHWSGATINDTKEVTRIEHKAASTGTVIQYTSPDDTTINTGGPFKIENLLVVGVSTTTKIMQIQYATKSFSMSNVYIGVHEDATACQGLDIIDSWTGIFKNITLYHGSANGTNGTASTGIGIKVWNISDDGLGGAMNQLVFQDIFVQYFGTNIQIGETNAAGAMSVNLNSIVFLGGASQIATTTGIWIGSGMESVSFTGMHVEQAGKTGLYIGYNAINVAFRDCKFHQNSEDASGKEIWLDTTGGGIDNITLENIFLSNVTTVGIKIESGSTMRNIRLNGLVFSPKTTGVGTGINIDTTNPIKNLLLENVTYDHNGNSFSTNISGEKNSYNLRKNKIVNAETANRTLASNETNGYFSNSGATGTVTLTLPAAAVGLRFRFVKLTDQIFKITAGTGDIIGNGSAAGSIKADAAGELASFVELEAVGGTYWIIVSQTGTWTAV